MPTPLPKRGPVVRSWSRGDLPPVPGPAAGPQAWSDRGRALEELRAWAQERTVATIDWYLRDKQPKRQASRLLRAAAIACAVAGGVLPLLATSASGIDASLGYVFLALAAGCVAFDHFFGISSGWMRDVATSQALQGRLAQFYLDWVRWQATQAGALPPEGQPGTDAVAAGLDLVGTLMADVAKITEAETAQWITEFSSSVAALRQLASPGAASPQDLITWNGPEK